MKQQTKLKFLMTKLCKLPKIFDDCFKIVLRNPIKSEKKKLKITSVLVPLIFLLLLGQELKIAAQSAGVVDHTNCITTEGKESSNKCPEYFKPSDGKASTLEL